MKDETSDQRRRFTRAYEVLRKGIEQRAFPGGTFAIVQGDTLLALDAVGRFTHEANAPVVEAQTVYDIASLTKVVATTAMAMILYERGLIDLDLPVSAVLAEFGRQDERAEVTLRMLLAHTSGLPAYVKLFEQAEGREEMLRAACGVALVAAPGTRTEYSDIGFMVLGQALARIADEPLDGFCQREVFAPLAMQSAMYCPGEELRAAIPPTEDDRIYRARVVQGEVNDENAWAMGGVAGHAGLFVNAADLARFAACMLAGGRPILREQTIRTFAQRERQGHSRALGWDTPSAPSQSGEHFSENSIGHLGFTGTSLWVDLRQQVALALLTNRTWPDRQTQGIKQVRPAFHDAVIEELRGEARV